MTFWSDMFAVSSPLLFAWLACNCLSHLTLCPISLDWEQASAHLRFRYTPGGWILMLLCAEVTCFLPWKDTVFTSAVPAPRTVAITCVKRSTFVHGIYHGLHHTYQGLHHTYHRLHRTYHRLHRTCLWLHSIFHGLRWRLERRHISQYWHLVSQHPFN